MLKSWVCMLLLTVASSTLPAQGGLRPDDVKAADVRAVRAVVEGQLKALAAGDATKAFSYASPAIRQQFGDPGTFMDMVRSNYPMLIRPASVSFFRPEARDGAVAQGVHFRDREGKLWRAVYELARQPDKRWRINGCAVAPEDDASTT